MTDLAQEFASTIPTPPTFDTTEAERQHRKERLAGTFRIFSRFGFEEGGAGHVTARDPELTDHFWVNPFGTPFANIEPDDLLLVDHEGNVVEGDRPLNLAAFAIHSAIHAARPDVVAAAHTHSIYGKSWSALHRKLDPLTQDSCAFYEDHALYGEFNGPVLDLGEGDRMAAALGSSQGRHPGQPRPADGRRNGRRGRLVVHHDGAHVPEPIAGRGRRYPREDPSRGRAPDARRGGIGPRRLVQLPDHLGQGDGRLRRSCLPRAALQRTDGADMADDAVRVVARDQSGEGGIELEQRRHHEVAVVHAGMRNGQLGLIDRLVAKQQYIDVERPRAPVDHPNAIGCRFQLLGSGQQRSRGLGGLDRDDDVEEVVLRRPANGVGLIDSRDRNQVGEGRHRSSEVSPPITNVRAQPQIGQDWRRCR